MSGFNLRTDVPQGRKEFPVLPVRGGFIAFRNRCKKCIAGVQDSDITGSACVRLCLLKRRFLV
ncbi:MAG: hypothetical protein CVV39_01210 [Planctomycetes bacterium HGW-Planctomycetes-1]|nr:MAG: hypothetical protein CVV39_01210 [Planctomycetes bacterium HGW-Planctomycetes-1]